MSRWQNLLFDFNGILIDDERIHMLSLQKTLEQCAVHFTEEEYWERYLAYDDRDAFTMISREHGREVGKDRMPELDELIRRKAEHYFALIGDDPPMFPGAVDLVKNLEGRFRMILVSGARREEIAFVLSKSGLDGAFETIISADDVSHSKPDPESYLKGLEFLGCPRDTAVVIEDSFGGIRAAKAAGIEVIAVAHSYPVEALKAEANFVTANLRELEQLLVK